VSDQEHVDRWHRAYAAGRRWGDEPGELARLAVVWLRELGAAPSWRLLDVGCGYGRGTLSSRQAVGLRSEHNAWRHAGSR
jgi:SAM-dependent methyltransferase